VLARSETGSHAHSHAFVDKSVRCGGDSGMGKQCIGAILIDNVMHDDVQFAGRELPSRLFRTGSAAPRQHHAAAVGGATA
jgi:hypothetical protein